MGLVMTPEREDGTTAGTTRVAVPTVDDGLDDRQPRTERGHDSHDGACRDVVAHRHAGASATRRANPADQRRRDVHVDRRRPAACKTPHVTLQAEVSPGVYADVTRKSGRVVEDQEIVIAYTPSPLQRTGPQTHVWVAEWQAVPWLGSPDGDTLDMRGNVQARQLSVPRRGLDVDAR